MLAGGNPLFFFSMITKILYGTATFILLIALSLLFTQEMFCVEERYYTINQLEQRQDYEVLGTNCFTLKEYMEISKELKEKNRRELMYAELKDKHQIDSSSISSSVSWAFSNASNLS